MKAERFRSIDILLLFLVALLSTSVLCTLPVVFDSCVFNENARLTSGLVNLQKQDFSLFSVNPPLSSIVGALPAFLSTDVSCPDRYDYGLDPFVRHEDEAGRIFLETNPDSRKMIRNGRFCVLLFSVFGMFVCMLYSGWLFGKAGGALAGTLWLFSPYIMGHGTHIGPDVPSAAMALAATAAFHYALATNSSKWKLRSGILLGLAELTKFTLVVLYPLLTLLWFGYRFREWRKNSFRGVVREFWQLFLSWFLVSVIIVNAGYLFKGTLTPLRDFEFQSKLLAGPDPNGSGSRFKDSWLGRLPVPFPYDYVKGIDVQRVDFENGLGGRSYCWGRWGEHGWFSYYFIAILIKTPLGFLALFTLSSFLMARQSYRLSWRDEAFVLAPGLTLFLFVSSQTGFSVHSRYVIPALPFFFTTTARAGLVFSSLSSRIRRNARLIALQALVLCMTACGVFAVIMVYPHEISFFNSLTLLLPSPAPRLTSPTPQNMTEKIRSALMASSRAGGRFLLSSNVDWGQDVVRFDRRLKDMPEIKEIYVKLSGSEPLDAISVPVNIYQPRLTSGWYALSVDYLYAQNGFYSDFFKLSPAFVVGATIWVYHVSEQDAHEISFHDHDEAPHEED